MRTEYDIEAKMLKTAKRFGALFIKFDPRTCQGVPDRICIFRGTFFVEVKYPGEPPRVIQEKRIEQMRLRGAEVYVIDSIEKFEEVLETRSKRTP